MELQARLGVVGLGRDMQGRRGEVMHGTAKRDKAGTVRYGGGQLGPLGMAGKERNERNQ